jgi:hypothetical protein
MSPVGLGPPNDCAGEDQKQLYTRGPSSLQRGNPTSTNPGLYDSNTNLVLVLGLKPDTKTDWPSGRRCNMTRTPTAFRGLNASMGYVYILGKCFYIQSCSGFRVEINILSRIPGGYCD